MRDIKVLQNSLGKSDSNVIENKNQILADSKRVNVKLSKISC